MGGGGGTGDRGQDSKGKGDTQTTHVLCVGLQSCPTVPKFIMSSGRKSPRLQLVLVPSVCHSGIHLFTTDYSSSTYGTPTACMPMPGTARNRVPQPPSWDPEAPWCWLCHLSSIRTAGRDLADTEGVLVAWGLLHWLPPPLPHPGLSPPPLSQAPSLFWLIPTGQDSCP